MLFHVKAGSEAANTPLENRPEQASVKAEVMLSRSEAARKGGAEVEAGAELLVEGARRG